MRNLSLIIVIFLQLISQAHNCIAQKSDFSKGWLVYFSNEQICFPASSNEFLEGFFNTKSRKNGFDVKFSPYKDCILKQIAKQYPVTLFYSSDTMHVLEVLFKTAALDVKKNERQSTYYEVLYSNSKYTLGYAQNDSTRITLIKPYFKHDSIRAEKTRCPYYQGP